ncbi:MAG: PQQ-binding-like beta-propeller repeat protein [Vicinamibacterales bacterium]
MTDMAFGVRPGSAHRWLFVGGALLLAGVGTLAAQSSGRDYPQWRGRNRDGAASAFAEPATWPEALTRRWKVDVGEGYATPLVVANIVYVFTRRNGTEVMTALDAETGQERWHTSYPAPYAPATLAAAHGVGPKATPLFHLGKLFTLGITGIVSAFDAATGHIAWQTPAASEHPTYGMAVSPVGDQDLVIVHPGNHGPLTAFDANTGAVRWTGVGRSAYASPIIVELDGVRQVVTMTQASVLGVSLSDGTRLWEHPWPSRGTPSAITPLLYGQTLIVGGQSAGVAALKPARRDGAWVVDVVWQTTEVSLFLSNPVLIGNTLFGLSEKARGQFFALDAETGRVLWLGQPRQASNTAVVKAGNLLLLLDDDAELIVARSNRSGFEPLKRYTVANSETWAQPTVSGNRVFIKDVTSISLWTLN